MKPFGIPCALVCAWSLATTTTSAVDYLREVKPILAEHCFRCHGASQHKGGMRVDTASFALKGGDTGPGFIPRNSKESLIIQAVEGTHDLISRMPYKRPPLPEAQVRTLRDWIDSGGLAPADEAPEVARHWAFVPPRRPEVPRFVSAAPVRNPIDAFILARLEQERIEPSPEADRVTLIRRLALDLTGLPPRIEDLDAFLNDRTPQAYERLVERLLSSPHYGERWARHWLDIARYADSNGYSIDAPRQMWKYRDWVIGALNADLPFDQFTILQMAGDLLPGATLEQRIATGFHRNTPINEEGGIDKEQFRIESIIDRVNTTATAFLGVTLACAQCHDHKFDPFTQKEYFQLFAFLNNDDEPTIDVASREELTRRDDVRQRTKAVQQELDALVEARRKDLISWEESLSADAKGKLRKEAVAALETAPDKRTTRQWNSVHDAFRPNDPDVRRLKAQLDSLRKSEPMFPTAMVLAGRTEPRHSYVFIKGDFTRQGETVTPGVPAVLHSQMTTNRPQNRLDLANWMVSPDNPLLARVTMNRLWQQYFGRGLVETENDFGTQGTPPTHPELLDWLATEFARQNWSLKAMHKLIVTSATYRRSSMARPDLATQDPANRLIARQNRLRLDAEIVRDACLLATGVLSDKVGGPSVFPPQPDGVMNLGQSRREWKADAGEARFRRGLYTFFWRATPHPSLTVFDAPDATSACTRRLRSNTPLQSLTLLNDEAYFEFAQALARRLLERGQASDAERINLAFRLCVGRGPNDVERERLVRLLERQLEDLVARPDDAAQIAPGPLPANSDRSELAAWTMVSRVLLNLDETITRE